MLRLSDKSCNTQLALRWMERVPEGDEAGAVHHSVGEDKLSSGSKDESEPKRLLAVSILKGEKSLKMSSCLKQLADFSFFRRHRV